MAEWQWENQRSTPLPEYLTDGAEILLGIKFPKSYRDLVKVFHGASTLAKFSVDFSGQMWGGCVGLLVSLDPHQDNNLFLALEGLVNAEAVNNPHLRRVIPIACERDKWSGWGDRWICLDYRDVDADQEPKVAYWFSELHGAESVAPIAENFDAFLAMLQPGEE